VIRTTKVPASRAARPDRSSHGIGSSEISPLSCVITVASPRPNQPSDSTGILAGMACVELRIAGVWSSPTPFRTRETAERQDQLPSRRPGIASLAIPGVAVS
jgi:hypothetical protein